MSDAPGIGHNQPSAIERALELVHSVEERLPAEITSEEQSGLVQELMVQLQKCGPQLEEAMKAERKPFDDQAAAVRVKYRDPMTLVGMALKRVKERLAPWLQAKDDRLKREADERRQAAEASARAAERAQVEALRTGSIEKALEARHAIEAADEAAAAAAKPVERAQVKGDLAPRASSLVERWFAEVVNEDKAIRHFIKGGEVREATLNKIRQVASRLARDLKDETKAPPGCRFKRSEEVR